MSPKQSKPSRSDVLRIAGEAQCDPRTVQSFLDGNAIRPIVEERIRSAMKRIGITI